MVFDVDPVTLIIVGAGLGGVALRRRYRRRVLREEASAYDEDADVALHVARHEAITRKHPWLSPLHILYGLLQDEQVAAAVRATGGDPDALEDRALAGLDAHVWSIEAARAGGKLLAYARMNAQQSARRPGCTDLWAALRFAPEALALCEAARVDHLAVLFRLFHGDEPAPAERLTGDVEVVLRNDHYTTKEFVCEVLEQVFALEPDVAVTRMETVHVQGEAVVGRFPADEARARVREVRRRAHAAGCPLWIGVVPA